MIRKRGPLNPCNVIGYPYPVCKLVIGCDGWGIIRIVKGAVGGIVPDRDRQAATARLREIPASSIFTQKRIPSKSSEMVLFSVF